MKVKTDMNATEDFFEVVTAGHIVAVTLHACSMTDLEDTPHVAPFDVDTDELSPNQKWILLSSFIYPWHPRKACEANHGDPRLTKTSRKIQEEEERGF